MKWKINEAKNKKRTTDRYKYGKYRVEIASLSNYKTMERLAGKKEERSQGQGKAFRLK